MNRLKPGVDVVRDVLVLVVEALPHSGFASSLLRQYDERGGLSKKQLEGLYFKAEKVETVSQAKLATLKAIILKKPTRNKSSLPTPTPLFTKDPEQGKMIALILEKYPNHKRVLFLQAKYENNEVLTPADITDLRTITRAIDRL